VSTPIIRNSQKGVESPGYSQASVSRTWSDLKLPKGSRKISFRGDVYSPEEIITRDIAEKGFRLAKEVAEVVRSYLKRRNVI